MRTLGGSAGRAPLDARGDLRARGVQTRRRRRTRTSTYAIPVIVEPRTALAPGTPASASVSDARHLRRDLGRRMAHPVGDDADLRDRPDRGSRRATGAAAPRSPRHRRPPARPTMTSQWWRAHQATRRRDHRRLQRDLAGVASPSAPVGVEEERRARRPPARSRCSPESTTANPCLRNVSPISIGRFSNLKPAPVQASTYGPSGDCSDRRRRARPAPGAAAAPARPSRPRPGAAVAAARPRRSKADARRRAIPALRGAPLVRRDRERAGAARRRREGAGLVVVERGDLDRRRRAPRSSPSALDRRPGRAARATGPAASGWRTKSTMLCLRTFSTAAKIACSAASAGRLRRAGHGPPAPAPSGRSDTRPERRRAPPGASGRRSGRRRAAAVSAGGHGQADGDRRGQRRRAGREASSSQAEAGDDHLAMKASGRMNSSSRCPRGRGCGSARCSPGRLVGSNGK